MSAREREASHAHSITVVFALTATDRRTAEEAVRGRIAERMWHGPDTGDHDLPHPFIGWSIEEAAPTSGETTTYTPSPAIVAKLADECDRVAEQWVPVAEAIADAKAALARVQPPHNPRMDADRLYYPLLFLVQRIEEYDRAE